jgi:hypothetical protein
MNAAIRSYFEGAMVGAGFCVLCPAVAWQLRPSAWAGRARAIADFSRCRDEVEVLAKGANHALYVRVEGRPEPVLVAANSLDRLAERIGWTAGLAVVEVAPWVASEAAPGSTGDARRFTSGFENTDARVAVDAAKRAVAARFVEALELLRTGEREGWTTERQQAFRECWDMAQELRRTDAFLQKAKNLVGVSFRRDHLGQMLDLAFESPTASSTGD